MHFPHPKNLVRFCGRLGRLDFWMHYLGVVLGLFITTLVGVVITAVLPARWTWLHALADLLVLGAVLLLVTSLIGAIVRRLRDSGRKPWIVPAALASLFAGVVAFFLEGVAIMTHEQTGTLSAYAQARLPITELVLLVALVTGWMLFRGLIAPSAAPEAPDADIEFPRDMN